MSENLIIPPSLFNSGLSWRARLLYVDFTNLAVDNYLSPSQAVFAKDYGCSKTTIGRAIKELIKAGLLSDLGQRDVKRRKKYGLISPLCKRGVGGDFNSGTEEIPLNPPFAKGEILGAYANTEEEYMETLSEADQIVYITGKYVPLWEEANPDLYKSITACFKLREAIKHILRGSTRHRRAEKKDVKTWVLERVRILEATFKPPTSSIKPIDYAVWG